MEHKIFSSERVNTGRQREVDLLKAFSIFMMIVTHVIDDLYKGYDAHAPFMVINDILAQSVGAMGFMICMGIGVIYSVNASWDKYVRRGISLLITGQFLNIIRYAVPGILRFIITGEESGRDWCMLSFSSDILEFAGLFFICMGLFSYFRLKSGHIFIISVITNIAGVLLAQKFNTGYYGVDQLIGMFVFTETESYFPLLNWLIYPAFGMILGDILQHVADKKRFYGYCIIPATIVWAVYYYLGIFTQQSVLKFYNEWQSMAYVNLADALFQLISNFSMMCMFYFLSVPLRGRAQKGIEYVSKNINRYYCIHSVIIFVLAEIINLIDGFTLNTLICYVLIAVVTTVTTILVVLYDRYGEPVRKFVSKHRALCYTSVIIASIFLCFFASMGENRYPNMHNGYGER